MSDDQRKRDDQTGRASKRGYFGEIGAAASSILEGLSVTFAQLTRHLEGMNHTTVEYPDRTAVPVADSLPERYRGFLEVDMDICTACKACERDCPINCIVIDLEKKEGLRVMTRFDIDMGKCMYCGICVESCPVEAHAPGDEEPTKCIRMTREFEATTSNLSTLTFRFIRPGDDVPLFKPTKGQIETTRRRGEIAREVRKKAAEYNALACEWALEHSTVALSPSLQELVEPAAVLARAQELAPQVQAAAGDVRGLEELLYTQALAQTDCTACGWPSCRDYARALIDGRDRELHKCEPGGAQTTRDLHLVFQLRLGKRPEEAAAAAAQATRKHHR